MSRTGKLREKMKDAAMDALLVTSELNQRYLSGYPFTDGLLLITQKSAYLITDFRYYEEAQKNAFPEYEVVVVDARRAFITGVFEEEHIATVGYEDLTMPCAELARYKKMYGTVDFIAAGGMIEQLRMVKDEQELAFIAKAQEIAEAAYLDLLQSLVLDMTEAEVAYELEYRMKQRGAEGFAFETIAVSGSASALPHGKPRNVKLERGFLTLDFGAMYNGYLSDMTRTVSIGKADAEMRRLYDTVLQAQLLALDSICAGADCAACDQAARAHIDGAGYEGCFGHSLGHGVGLFIHESPRLSRGAEGERLEVGNVVTVEPGIYLFGKYGCRIEDMVAVTENGYRNFTHISKQLLEIY